MNRLAAALLTLALALPSTLHAQDQYEQQVRNQLDAASESFRNNGYTRSHDVQVGSLDDGEDESVTYQLQSGLTYMIMGVCDTDCSDLDLVLYTGDGNELDSDLELDDVPIVDVTVERGGSFRVEVRMADCEEAPCRYGLGVYSRSGSGSGSSAGSGRSSSTSAGTGSDPNWQADPSYGTIDLDAGFNPDPYEREVSAGGDDEVDLSAPNCSGYIHAEAPDLDLNYEAGSLELYLYARSKTDVTLVVNQPDGTWVCSDDEMGSDPMIRLQSPRSGNYNIWIGTYEASSSPLPVSTLYISEIDPR